MQSHAKPAATCPSCYGCLRPAGDRVASWRCEVCETDYPLIKGRIPILVRDPPRFLSTLYRQYLSYIQQCQAHIRELQKATQTHPHRKPLLETYQTAVRHNASIIRDMMDEIEPHVVSEMVAATTDTSSDLPYATNFNYLRRDWGRCEATETELATIERSLKELIAGLPNEPESALVLGAGPGRTAWDLCKQIPAVTAVDLSYTMASFFDRVTTDSLSFYDINHANMLRREDLVRRMTVSLSPTSSSSVRVSEALQTFSYYVADASSLPFLDESLDAVLSIYFTDVLPFDRMIREVKRVLKTGGTFIHFGPLDYHFSDHGAYLSAEELRESLQRHQFDILHESTVQTSHLIKSGQMVTHLYDNWIFAAVNLNSSRESLVHLDCVLVIPESIRYEIAGVVSCPESTEVAVFLPDGTKYECGSGVPTLLSFVDGRRTVRDVIDLMRDHFQMSHDSATDEIVASIKTLVTDQIVSVTGPQ